MRVYFLFDMTALSRQDYAIFGLGVNIVNKVFLAPIS